MKPYFETDLGKLYHGDCLEIMPELEPVDLVLTDPPYRTISGGTSSKLPSGWRISVLRKNDGKIFKHNNLMPSEYIPILFNVCKEDADIYIMTNNKTIRALLNAAFRNGLSFHNLLIWLKNTKTANRWYMSETEYVLYFWKGRARPISNKSSSQVFYGLNPTNKKHPTEKPITLMAHYVKNSSKRGDVILDPFLGSGTTAIACERLNRKWIGIEIEERYCQIAAKRIENERRQLKLF